MRGPPRVQLTIRLVARIHVGEGDSFGAGGNRKLEGKVAFLSSHGAVVDPPRDQPAREAESFKKLDLLRLGGKPVHARMFQYEIERQEPPHHHRWAGRAPVADVLDPQRPVDRLARYPARLSSPIDYRRRTLDRRLAVKQ